MLEDHLLNQVDYCKAIFENPPTGHKDVAKLMYHHAKFISQAITLSQFFPLSPAGKIMTEPKREDYDDYGIYIFDVDLYIDAKRRVIFQHDWPEEYVRSIIDWAYTIEDAIKAHIKLIPVPSIRTSLGYQV